MQLLAGNRADGRTDAEVAVLQLLVGGELGWAGLESDPAVDHYPLRQDFGRFRYRTERRIALRTGTLAERSTGRVAEFPE